MTRKAKDGTSKTPRTSKQAKPGLQPAELPLNFPPPPGVYRSYPMSVQNKKSDPPDEPAVEPVEKPPAPSRSSEVKPLSRVVVYSPLRLSSGEG
jgi:hypothetical protein